MMNYHEIYRTQDFWIPDGEPITLNFYVAELETINHRLLLKQVSNES
jgi:hypothetical protein